MNESALVIVRRFDPSRGAWWDRFEGIPYRDLTVLDVARYIHQERDATLAFREPCTRGFCGGCAMVVNGEPVLSCQKLATPRMTITPHPKFEVIKDLVIDFDRLRG